MSASLYLDYDKIFPSYVRGNGCYLDVLPKDVTNIIYDFKYDGSNTIYNDITKLRIIKDERNILDDIVTRENTPISIQTYCQFFKKIMPIFEGLKKNENDIFRFATCFIIMWYIFLYNTDLDIKKQNIPCQSIKKLITSIKYRLMEIDSLMHLYFAVILKHYVPTLLNRLDIITISFETINDN